MRSVLVVGLVISGACSKASERVLPSTGSAQDTKAAIAVAVVDAAVPDAATAPDRRLAIPATRPTTAILITNHCHQAPHPPATYFWSASSTYDLEGGTWTSARREGSSHSPRLTRPGEAPGPDDPKVETRAGKIDPAKLTTIRTRLAELLAGGPYEPKYPFSGGSRCTLSLHQKDQAPFFSIDRADQSIDDEVTRLVTAL